MGSAGHFGFESAVIHAHMQTIAGSDFASVANRASVFVRDDCIAAAEHFERAHRIEASGE